MQEMANAVVIAKSEIDHTRAVFAEAVKKNELEAVQIVQECSR